MSRPDSSMKLIEKLNSSLKTIGEINDDMISRSMHKNERLRPILAIKDTDEVMVELSNIWLPVGNERKDGIHSHCSDWSDWHN